MIKKLLTVITLCSTLGLYAQKSNVESAAIYLRNSEMEDAKKAIDAAAVNDETKDDPKMWFYRAAVYDTIYRNPEYKKLDANVEENLATACRKCMETDTKKRYEYYCSVAIINSAFACYNKAIEYYQAADYKNALKYFQYVLDVVPYDKNKDLIKNNINEKSITLTMADMALKSKDYDNAKKNLQKLIDMDYNDPIIYILMGNIFETQGDTAKALSYIEQGRKRFPTDKDLINQELNIYLSQGKQQELLGKLNDAINLDPENATLLFVRGNVYDNFANDAMKQAKHQRDTAATLSKKAKNEKSPAAKTNLENASKNFAKQSEANYKNNKEYVVLAEKDYIEVTKLNAEYVDAWYNLGALTNNKTTEIVEKMNALSSSNQQEYDRKWNAMKKVQDSILNVALGYFQKSLDLAEVMPEADENQKKMKNETLKSILFSMQQVYANLGDEKKTMEIKKRRTELE